MKSFWQNACKENGKSIYCNRNRNDRGREVTTHINYTLISVTAFRTENDLDKIKIS